MRGKIVDHDGCSGCKNFHCEQDEEPCKACRGNYPDGVKDFFPDMYEPAGEKADAEKEEEDMVDHPSYYDQGNVECIDAMLQCFGPEWTFHFCVLNMFKYTWRCKNKHKTPIEDVKKAAKYADFAMLLWEGMNK